MPSPTAFRREFGISKGGRLPVDATASGPALVVTSCTCGHDVVKPFERYEFPLRCTVAAADEEAAAGSATPAADAALRLLTAATTGERIVYSAFGSPYRCTVGVWHADATAPGSGSRTFTARGVGVRARDIPTARQAAATASDDDGGGAAAATAEELAALRLSHRVIKSAWGTGRCAACGRAIAVGVYIAKRAGASAASGGWSHAACVVPRGGSSEPAAPPAAKRSRAQAVSGAVREAASDGGRVTRARARAAAASGRAGGGGGTGVAGVKRGRGY